MGFEPLPETGTDWKAQAASLNIPSDLELDPTSAFAGVRNDMRGSVLANPKLMADYLYPGAPLTAASQAEWLNNIKTLSDFGLLTDVPNADIFNARPSSEITTLKQIEDVKNAMPEFNSEIDPRWVYQEAFTRILNSDANKFRDPERGGTEGDPENQVAVTNGMLSVVTPFIYQPQQEAYIAELNRAGMQYISEVAGGKTTMSYPEWLKASGAVNWM